MLPYDLLPSEFFSGGDDDSSQVIPYLRRLNLRQWKKCLSDCATLTPLVVYMDAHSAPQARKVSRWERRIAHTGHVTGRVVRAGGRAVYNAGRSLRDYVGAHKKEIAVFRRRVAPRNGFLYENLFRVGGPAFGYGVARVGLEILLGGGDLKQYADEVVLRPGAAALAAYLTSRSGERVTRYLGPFVLAGAAGGLEVSGLSGVPAFYSHFAAADEIFKQWLGLGLDHRYWNGAMCSMGFGLRKLYKMYVARRG